MASRQSILLVTAEEKNAGNLVSVLEKEYLIYMASDRKEAEKLLPEICPVLILLDEDLSGQESAAAWIKAWKEEPKHANIPVLLLLADREDGKGIEGLEAGAEDVCQKSSPPEFLAYRVEKSLSVAALKRKLQEKREQIRQISRQSIMTIAEMIDAKDRYANGRTIRVALCCREIAKKLDWTESEVETLYYVALLHDIGNLALEDAVLNKTTALTEDEYDAIRQHTVIGGNIVKDTTFIPGVQDGVRYHHEYFDGRGYDGLAGDEIPLVARIIAVADAYEAMTSNRAYRSRMPVEEVKEQLVIGRGSQFDPVIVDTLLELLEEGLDLDEKEADESFNKGETIGEVGSLLHQVFTETVQEAQNELEKDSLTGFLTRNHFAGKINTYLMETNARGSFFMMDMDNFKYVNDTFGHAKGDELILAFADVLKANIRGNDYVCRMGGDEFAIFFPEMDKDHVIRQRAENIIRLFAEKRDELGCYKCSVSIGIFIKYADSSEKTCEELYNFADKALYYVKNNGKDDYHLYSFMSDSDRNRSLMEKQMDLSALLEQVEEHRRTSRPLPAGSSYFSYIYQFIVRHIKRCQKRAQIILLSLNLEDCMEVSEDREKDCMDILENAIKSSLRRGGDVSARFSKTQQIVILMDANQENGTRIAQRIAERYQVLAEDRAIAISYEVAEVLAEEE